MKMEYKKRNNALGRMETQRLILRRFRREDLQDLYEYLSDEEVVRFEPYRPMDLQAVGEIWTGEFLRRR